MNDELTEYINKLNEEYHDIKQVEVYADETRIIVNKDSDSSHGLGQHVMEEFLKHGYVVSSTGRYQAEFTKVEVSMEFVR